MKQCSKCKRTHMRLGQRYCWACHAAQMRRHRAANAAAIDELATAALERCGVPVPRKRTRRVKAALEALDELAAARSTRGSAS